MTTQYWSFLWVLFLEQLLKKKRFFCFLIIVTNSNKNHNSIMVQLIFFMGGCGTASSSFLQDKQMCIEVCWMWSWALACSISDENATLVFQSRYRPRVKVHICLWQSLHLNCCLQLLKCFQCGVHCWTVWTKVHNLNFNSDISIDTIGLWISVKIGLSN